MLFNLRFRQFQFFNRWLYLAINGLQIWRKFNIIQVFQILRHVTLKIFVHALCLCYGLFVKNLTDLLRIVLLHPVWNKEDLVQKVDAPVLLAMRGQSCVGFGHQVFEILEDYHGQWLDLFVKHLKLSGNNLMFFNVNLAIHFLPKILHVYLSLEQDVNLIIINSAFIWRQINLIIIGFIFQVRRLHAQQCFLQFMIDFPLYSLHKLFNLLWFLIVL